jgi:hypothetical protein
VAQFGPEEDGANGLRWRRGCEPVRPWELGDRFKAMVYAEGIGPGGWTARFAGGGDENGQQRGERINQTGGAVYIQIITDFSHSTSSWHAGCCPLLVGSMLLRLNVIDTD